ncbi:hypothetical protein VNO78_01056 [Psophocarpus tetragonolobus]|uniref:Uncharacterized protein n=1 Tax=Psophocarpus tetragonolobus TaxID=3891 RepID=A0AAN9XUG4_PSOTE
MLEINHDQCKDFEEFQKEKLMAKCNVGSQCHIKGIMKRNTSEKKPIKKPLLILSTLNQPQTKEFARSISNRYAEPKLSTTILMLLTTYVKAQLLFGIASCSLSMVAVIVQHNFCLITLVGETESLLVL